MASKDYKMADKDYNLELNKLQFELITRTKFGKTSPTDISIINRNSQLRDEIVNNNRGKARLALLKTEWKYQRERGHSPRIIIQQLGIK